MEVTKEISVPARVTAGVPHQKFNISKKKIIKKKKKEKTVWGMKSH